MTYDTNTIQSYIPIVKSIAKKYATNNNEYEDLVSEGYVYMLYYMNNHDTIVKSNFYNALDSKIKNYINRIAKNNLVVTDIENVTYTTNPILLDKRKMNNDIKELLSEREYYVIVHYFGIFGEKQSLVEISKAYNISSERIRVTKVKALNKIRAYLAKLGIYSIEDLYI